MDTFVLKRRGRWNDVKTAVVIVGAETPAHARVIACEMTNENSWGWEAFSTCELFDEDQPVMVPGGEAFARDA